MSNSFVETNSLQTEEQAAVLNLGTICHYLGYASIIASIGVWFFVGSADTAAAAAHAERFGIFVGLWAPTFFILSMKYDATRL